MNDILNLMSEQFNQFYMELVERMPAIGAAVFLLLLTWVISRIADRVLSRVLDHAGPRKSLQVFFRKISTITLWTLGILIAAMVIFPSITPSKLLSVLGLGSIAVGFAFRDIFENFIAGMLILLREPFRLGDHVACEGITGEVLDITVRDTRLGQVTGEQVILPNAMLFKNAVTVQTGNALRRIHAICGVAYNTDLEKAAQVIEAAIRKGHTVHAEEKPVQVFLNSFSASSIDFELAWWTESDPLSERRSRNEVLHSVKKALDKAEIEIPFPQRTLRFPEHLSLANSEDAT